MVAKLQYFYINYEKTTIIVPLKKTTTKRFKAAQSSAAKEIITDEIELKCITEAMLDKKAQAVCSMDLRNIGTAITDHFVICHADSAPQVIAIADNVEEKMYTQCNRKVVRAQGKENAFWIIMDFTNIVVHIFKTEYRQFYRLEELWADAIKTNYQDDKQ